MSAVIPKPASVSGAKIQNPPEKGFLYQDVFIGGQSARLKWKGQTRMARPAKFQRRLAADVERRRPVGSDSDRCAWASPFSKFE